MELQRIIGEMAAAVAGLPARRVIVGLNWTLVESADGCGLAHTPSRGTSGCFSLPGAGRYRGRGIDELAALRQSENPFEVAIAHAAINAHYNRFDLEGAAINGLDVIDGAGPITVIGRFPGLSQRFSDVRIVEREPRDGEYPESAAPALLAESRGVIITGSALANGSLGPLLEAAGNARVVLIGPSTPLSPRLFDLGIAALAGVIVAQPDAAARVIGEGGAVRALKAHCRYLTLSYSEKSE